MLPILSLLVHPGLRARESKNLEDRRFTRYTILELQSSIDHMNVKPSLKNCEAIKDEVTNLKRLHSQLGSLGPFHLFLQEHSIKVDPDKRPLTLRSRVEQLKSGSSEYLELYSAVEETGKLVRISISRLQQTYERILNSALDIGIRVSEELENEKDKQCSDYAKELKDKIRNLALDYRQVMTSLHWEQEHLLGTFYLLIQKQEDSSN